MGGGIFEQSKHEVAIEFINSANQLELITSQAQALHGAEFHAPPLRVSLGCCVACNFEMQASLIVHLSIRIVPRVRSRPTRAFRSHLPLISRTRNASHSN